MTAKCRPKPKREDLPYFRPDCGTYMPCHRLARLVKVAVW
jgi:hypothetical protein